jgi:phosphoglycerate dehydrogenase-like enzyme
LQILISTSTFNLKNFSGLSAVNNSGIDVKLNPFNSRLTEDQVIDLLGKNSIGLIAGLEPLNEKVLQSATELKVIARVGTGLDNVDLAAAKKLGIKVLNTPDAPTSAVAELTLGHILGLLRKIARTISGKGKWDRYWRLRRLELSALVVLGEKFQDLFQHLGQKLLCTTRLYVPKILKTAHLKNYAHNQMC